MTGHELLESIPISAPTAAPGITVTNTGECEAVCPKEIRLDSIAMLNRDLRAVLWKRRP